ncbi:MAG: DUF1598 domain-containing protein [Planctomycetaceae bacterium]
MTHLHSRLLAVALVVFAASDCFAQTGFGSQRAVGGVVVDTNGVIRSATVDERSKTLAAMRQSVRAAAGELAEPSELRMISLAKLQAALVEAEASGQPLPDEMRYLAGLQRVEYLFVYPEQNDIVIAGPAEPWVVRDDASVVGVRSGRPVVTLDDLVIAFRSVENARQEGITCSIEPTPEGSQRLQQLFQRITLRPGQDPRGFEPAMREAFGPQLIKLTGVPKDSHYARTLVAADYQMKRIAMALENSPIEGLPSYLAISQAKRHTAGSNPRWWMACHYDAMSRTEDKLAWKLAGQGVKTLTETDAIGKDGAVIQTNKVDPLAKKWADMMTAQYEPLSGAQAVFGELRNCMDLSVMATLVVQERLAELAGCDLSHLMGSVDVEKYQIPQTVDPQCSFVRGRSGWIVTASGGVDVNAFEVVEQQVTTPELADVRNRRAAAVAATWWWNG